MSMEVDSLKANDLFIPDGVTFVVTIHAPGLAEINGSVSGDVHNSAIR